MTDFIVAGCSPDEGISNMTLHRNHRNVVFSRLEILVGCIFILQDFSEGDTLLSLQSSFSRLFPIKIHRV